MEKQYYIPAPNAEFNGFLKNFASKVPNYSIKYSITGPEQKDMLDFSNDFEYRLDASNQVDAYNQQTNAYRNALRYGVPEGSTVQAPVAPTLIPYSPVSDTGGTLRLTRLVEKIKTNPAYSVADGKDMGIEGAEIVINPNELQPEIKPITGTAGKPAFSWKKGHTEGIEIHKNDGSGYKKYDTDIHPNYQDKAPLPENAGVWKYKCMYLFHGDTVGQWSNELSFNVSA